jgi:hypothetical protein
MAVLIIMAAITAMFTVLLFSTANRDKRLIAHITKIERDLNNLMSAYRGMGDVTGGDRPRDEFILSLRGMGDSITRLAADITQSQQSQLDLFAGHLNWIKNENDRLAVEIRAIADEHTGFAAITPEKLSADIWEMLDSAYGEITQFAGALARTQKKLRQATKSIEDATRKSRVIEKRLISAPRFHRKIKRAE